MSKKVKIKRYLANSKGQDLARHSVLVGRLAAAMIRALYSDSEEDMAAVELMVRLALIAGLLHDVGKLDEIFQKYIVERAGKDENVIHGVQISDDFGVFDVTKFSFENYPRHEETSWVMIRTLMNKSWFQKTCLGGDQTNTLNQNETRFSVVTHAVYFHHAKPARAPGQQEEMFGDSNKIAQLLNAASDWFMTRSYDDFKNLLMQMEEHEPSGLVDCIQELDVSDAHKTPAFKAMYEDENRLKGPNAIQELDKALNMESRRTAIRSAVVSADRIVSSLTPEELDHFVESNTLPQWQDSPVEIGVTYAQIDAVVQKFAEDHPGERTEIQLKAAQKLARAAKFNKVTCLQGPAGCGKTKISQQFMLEASLLHAASGSSEFKRTYIFVPRTAIGESLYEEFINDYKVTHRVELLTGNRKSFCDNVSGSHPTEEHEMGEGNIIITTIDQLCKNMLSHSNIDMISRLATSHVIFDEFHELFDIPGISLLFYEIMKLRSISKAGTVMVSATPMKYLLTRLGVDADQIISVPTFNKKPLQLTMENWSPEVYARGDKKIMHPFINGEVEFKNNSFVVCNTATVAQNTSIFQLVSNRDLICFHSKFPARKKSEILKATLQTFGKSALPSNKILVAGPIVQASLNISTEYLHTEGCTAENFAQRIGRNNRFAFLPISYVFAYFAAKGNGLANGAELADMHQRARVESYHKFLKERVGSSNKVQLDLAEFYKWNDEYHDLQSTHDAYESDFLSILEASVKIFRKNDFDPTYVPDFEKKNARGDKKEKDGFLANNNLRQSTMHVLPLKIDIQDLTKPAKCSLLWNADSHYSDVMTDDLRSTEYDGALGNKFVDWTSNAYKPSVISSKHADESELSFLNGVARRMKQYRKWDRMKYQAYDRRKPIVVSKSKYDDDCMYYLSIKGIDVGLIKASSIIRNISHTKFNLADFL